MVYLRLCPCLYLNLYLNPNLDLGLNLDLSLFLKSSQQLSPQFFTWSFGTLFNLRYRQL